MRSRPGQPQRGGRYQPGDYPLEQTFPTLISSPNGAPEKPALPQGRFMAQQCRFMLRRGAYEASMPAVTV